MKEFTVTFDKSALSFLTRSVFVSSGWDLCTRLYCLLVSGLTWEPEYLGYDRIKSLLYVGLVIVS